MKSNQNRLIHFRFNEPIYTSTVHLHVGEPKAFERWLHRSGHTNLIVDKNVAGKWISLKDENILTSHIFLSRRLMAGSNDWIVSSVAHESLHATSSVMRTIGLHHCEQSEESWAYYLDWLVGNIIKAIG